VTGSLAFFSFGGDVFASATGDGGAVSTGADEVTGDDAPCGGEPS